MDLEVAIWRLEILETLHETYNIFTVSLPIRVLIAVQGPKALILNQTVPQCQSLKDGINRDDITPFCRQFSSHLSPSVNQTFMSENEVCTALTPPDSI